MLLILSGLAALLLLLLALKLSQRLTLRLKVLAGVTLSRHPQKSCPHLGQSDDPFNHVSAPSDDHRCYLYMQRDRIDLLHQKSFCLSTAHYKCPWLMIRRPDAPPPLGVRVRRLLVGGPRPAWVVAFSALKRATAVVLSGRFGLLAAVRLVLRGIDTATSRLARAIKSVGRDLLLGLDKLVGRLAAAIRHVAADLWSKAEHSGSVARVLTRAAGFLFRALWWLVRTPARLMWKVVGSLFERRRAARAARAAAAVSMPAEVALSVSPEGPEAAASPDLLDEQRRGLAALFPGLEAIDTEVISPLPGEVADVLPATFDQPIAEALAASAARVDSAGQPDELISQRLEAPLARFEELLARLETLLSDGVSALDSGQETLAYELFLKATEQPTKLAERAAPELQSQHSSLMTRAWFWRAKTAETVDEVVGTLEQALHYEPENLQIQAHLAWARQRLERDRHVREGSKASAELVGAARPAAAKSRRFGLLHAVGSFIRVAGGLMALAFAALWMTTGVMPALGRFLTQLPAGDELLLDKLILTVNAAALPGHGHLPLPIVNYDLGLSLPFVMAFSFVFTARGLMDGDGWARTTGLFFAGVGGWLCLAAVNNPEASRVGLALCIGIIVAALVGRFDSPKSGVRELVGY